MHRIELHGRAVPGRRGGGRRCRARQPDSRVDRAPLPGVAAGRLAAEAAEPPNLTVLRDVSSQDAQCLRAATAVGVFPTRVIPGFIETCCVAALEYQALGVPVLASAIGGVPEAVPGDLASRAAARPHREVPLHAWDADPYRTAW